MTILYLGCPATEKDETEAVLSGAGLSVTSVESPQAVLTELAAREMPVLLDLSRGAAALQLARDIRSQFASALVFAVVDPNRPDLTTEAVLAGSADVFARPLGGRCVAHAIERELHHGSRKPVASEDLYGHSPAMHEVMALIARASGVRVGVMIRGEEGSGRQAVARTIHAGATSRPADGRKTGNAGAFVAINCAEYDSSDLETVLFGAAGDLKGVEKVSAESAIHQARDGSLYLQNVAELPTRLQSRLARLLRDREAVIDTSGEFVHLDVRPMTSVDPAFDSDVKDGRIREHLVRRLSVIRIEMPPLRHRREDIPALANYFLRDICAREGQPPKTFSRPALALLAALPWRGNADELHALLDSIVRGIQGGRNLGLEDVLAHVHLDGGAMALKNAGTLKQARAKFERDYIAAILAQTKGRISDAARVLGIQRTNLYRKMRTLRIKPARSGRSTGDWS